MSASVKPSSQPIGAIGTKAPHFQAPSAPQPNPVRLILIKQRIINSYLISARSYLLDYLQDIRF